MKLIGKKTKRIEKLEKENKALKNRCYALSSGKFCPFCPYECERRNCEFNSKESYML